MLGTDSAMTRTLPRLSALAASAALVLAVVGCGGDSFGKRYAVSGTVTYNGEPVEKGTITFHPVDLTTGRAATGQIVDGKYTLSTAGDRDGAFPGDYKVSISARDANLQGAMNPEGGSAKQDDVAKAYAEAKKLVPAKYELPDTSGLTFKVEAKSNTADFALTD